MHIDQIIHAVPPLVVYVLIGAIIGIESLGIPLPGEVALVSAALLSSQHAGVSPVWVGVCATAGAIIGDSIGYAIGRKGGTRVLQWAGRKFPKHFGPEHLAKAEDMFSRRGMWAVFFGRFVALLRILAGPLAGSLKMPYGKFLIANALGGIAWAGGTTAAVYFLGVVAEKWLSRFSWIGLIVAVVAGVVISLVVKRRMGRGQHKDQDSAGAAYAEAE